jgi:hypothetical protein
MAMTQVLRVELQKVDDTWATLRSGKVQSQLSDSYQLPLAQIQELLGNKDIYYEVLLPDLVAVGKQLYRWLNGDRGWLDRALSSCPFGETLVVAIDCRGDLAQLPWETLHNGQGFLVQQRVVPVRWRQGATPQHPVSPERLQVLMIASDPEGVKPQLDFEQEEAAILAATKDFPLELRMEETGSLGGLGVRWRSQFQVLHLSGHADISADGVPFFILEDDFGGRQDADAAAIAKILRGKMPPLIFLSGCRTAQSGRNSWCSRGPGRCWAGDDQ